MFNHDYKHTVGREKINCNTTISNALNEDKHGVRAFSREESGLYRQNAWPWSGREGRGSKSGWWRDTRGNQAELIV